MDGGVVDQGIERPIAVTLSIRKSFLYPIQEVEMSQALYNVMANSSLINTKPLNAQAAYALVKAARLPIDLNKASIS